MHCLASSNVQKANGSQLSNKIFFLILDFLPVCTCISILSYTTYKRRYEIHYTPSNITRVPSDLGRGTSLYKGYCMQQNQQIFIHGHKNFCRQSYRYHRSNIHSRQAILVNKITFVRFHLTKKSCFN